jgi:hypothetical protein
MPDLIGRGSQMAEINISGFSGANNVNEQFYSKKGIASPRVVLNADVSLDGELIVRKGKVLFVNLPGAHSLWANADCMLCAANGILYRISQGAAVNISTLAGLRYPLSYVEADEKVYISNPHWQGVFDPSTNTVTSFGVAAPPGPMLISGSGNLPAGNYHVTMTNVSGTELSGSGPISDIELTAEGGIQVLNRPAGALVWVTDADEGIFYLVGATSQIVDLPTVEPLPSFLCSPPPFLENLCYAFGRIWGSSGSDVYYSEPFKLGWFKTASNKFSFDSPVTLIAKVPTGLFVGMEDKTKFLAGTEPDQMVQSDAGAGSIKGTLDYCNNLPDLSSTLSTSEKGVVDVPVWLTTEGIVAGATSGTLYNLTKNKIKMGIPAQGASLYRNLEGVFQFLTSFKQGTTGSGKGFEDDDTVNVFKNGRIDVHNKRTDAMGSRAGFSDTATCTVTRGGVII